jgi:hypothetical protein
MARGATSQEIVVAVVLNPTVLSKIDFERGPSIKPLVLPSPSIAVRLRIAEHLPNLIPTCTGESLHN